MRVFNFRRPKMGGIWFFKVGRLNVSAPPLPLSACVHAGEIGQGGHRDTKRDFAGAVQHYHSGRHRDGQTVDAMIGLKPARVMLLSEAALRVEPDDVFMTMFAVTEDGQTAITCAGRCTL